MRLRDYYFSAVAWIAEHDGKSGMGALEPPAVACRPTVALVADVFGMRREAVANDVVSHRIGKPEPAPEPEQPTSSTKASTTVAVSEGKVWLNGRELVLPPKATYGLK
jgi:hypothetical protein